MTNLDGTELLPPGLQISPIQASGRVSHRVPAMMLAPLICGLWLTVGLYCFRSGMERSDLIPSEQPHAVPIVLNEAIFEPNLKDEPDSLGLGEGSLTGTDTVDPGLPERELRDSGLHVLPNELVPEVIPVTLPIDLSHGTYRTDLPKEPGGTGAARGTGYDIGRGNGSVPKRPAITPIYRVKPIFRTVRQRKGYFTVEIKILINEGGRIVHAEPQGGPSECYAVCLDAARKWVFNVPLEFRSKAPIPWVILFHSDPT